MKAFLKREPVFCAAFAAALISCFFVRPDSAYLAYFDFRTLALLYCLMVVVAGLREAGLFSALAHRLCTRTKTVRAMGLTLTALSFFSAMLITNDVALLTFVPFSIVVLGMAHEEKSLVWVIVAQTVAANLGSVLTPVGNPQNLYLYSFYDMSAGEFVSAVLPLWLLSLVLVLLLCLRLPRGAVRVSLGERPLIDRRLMRLYIVLFLVCLLVVVRVISWAVMLALLTAALSVFDRKRLKSADFMLLLSFVCFFVFSGNLARIDAVADALSGLLQGRELVTAALTSQVISNVPAALLLSGFTENARELLLGVNIGGLGTPVASLASLISLKLYSSAQGADSGAIMRCFLLVNIFMLIFLLAVFSVVL